MWDSLVLLEDSLGAVVTSSVLNLYSYGLLDSCARSPGVGLGIECSSLRLFVCRHRIRSLSLINLRITNVIMIVQNINCAKQI